MDIRSNIGQVEKIIRYVIGFCLLSLALLLDGDAKAWAILGLYPLATASVEFCPVWSLFKINTRSHTPTTHHPAH